MDTGKTDDGPELLITKQAATVVVHQALLDDYAGFDVADVLRRALNGEQVFREVPPPRRHRCLFCWLVSLLPGHERCNHGRMVCDDCYDD